MESRNHSLRITIRTNLIRLQRLHYSREADHPIQKARLHQNPVQQHINRGTRLIKSTPLQKVKPSPHFSTNIIASLDRTKHGSNDGVKFIDSHQQNIKFRIIKY